MFLGNTKKEGVSMWKGSFAILKKTQNHNITQNIFWDHLYQLVY